ncbi:DUF2232 domain-containing protein [Filobacillus milosensis]|uniref:DUF2232 domain-containing protein n=1 Tax=Filobacillus milosensis TaxID=94137 RepID=A0A4Y8INV0_9BACI|nr:DUF2232 domain-containing protein [Filobacillus milosensis]TFB21124.1 DUF2232 domain-containing protein [Filobacillus milosensis]
MKQSILKDGVMFGAIYIVMLFASYFIPLLGIVLTFVLPIPFVIFSYRYGLKASLIMFSFTLIISSVFVAAISVPMALFMGLGGLAIGLGLYNQRRAYETLALGTVGFSVGLALVYVLTQFFFQVNWMEEFRLAIDETLSTYSTMVNQFSEVSEENLEAIREQMKMMVYKLPSFIVMFGLFYAWVTQWISHKLINKFEQRSFAFPKFKEFNLPLSIIWYYFLGLVLVLIFPSPDDSLFLVAENLYTLSGLLLSLQGLAFLFWVVHFKKWPRAIPIIVIILLVIQPLLLLYPLRILGIIDLGFQLRDRLMKK